VTGAYRFVITPGTETLMDVTARLFFRADVEQLGVAPLTSMFLFSEKNRASSTISAPMCMTATGCASCGAMATSSGGR
jgi:glucan biosynthesis protein